MVIDCDSILSRVPPPGAVPVSLAEAAQIWNANGMHGTLRELSIVGMVVKIQAPRPVKGELKGKWNTTLWIQDPTISSARAGDACPRWGFELTVWATVDSIHRLPRAEPGEILVAYPVHLTGSHGSIFSIKLSHSGMISEDQMDERMLVVIPKGAVAKDPRPAPGSVLPKNAPELKWIPDNKFEQRLYISALLQTLDNLVTFAAKEDPPPVIRSNGIPESKKAIVLPTRDAQDIGRFLKNQPSCVNLEGMVTRVRAIQKVNTSLSDPDGISCLIIDIWDGSERSSENALLERRPNEKKKEEAVCWGRSAIQPHTWRPFLRTCPIHLYGDAIKSAMAQQVSTGCYFRAFSVELCEESAVTGPWSIHRGTPRNGKRVVLRCSSDAPEGASSGIQILPPSYHRARKLSDLIMRRSAVWLGIPTVSYNETFEKFKNQSFNQASQAAAVEKQRMVEQRLAEGHAHMRAKHSETVNGGNGNPAAVPMNPGIKNEVIRAES
ncbi:Oidioi.mRNA.OKI2018_I69.XSR.g15449.t2.cds [Oikopleura dioica]|uniref:Oidioi.mRNA.OKI2018_I69.XSR.g15449.t2.cds n=1 Tax=Oikopleura dioica TaxID=34765 RepID=A0ABN7SH28_OIKDI|nr:Oidioi.mRNA.OKI2018_I69.XSR.g15449.t2.cds [Oikopleura dioica]